MKIFDRKIKYTPDFYFFIVDLTFKTDNINCVKCGILLFTPVNKTFAYKDIQTLGLHDEFTYYVGLYLKVCCSDSTLLDSDLYSLLKRVHLYGRSKCLEFFSDEIKSDEICEWLLSDSYISKYMIYNDNIRYCAEKAKLFDLLSAGNVSKKLYESSIQLLSYLVSRRYYYLTHGYDKEFQCIKSIIGFAKDFVKQIDDALFLSKLHGALLQLKYEFTENLEDINGFEIWNIERIEECLNELLPIINNRELEGCDIIKENLKSDDEILFYESVNKAFVLGWDKEVCIAVLLKYSAFRCVNVLKNIVLNKLNDDNIDDFISDVCQFVPLKELSNLQFNKESYEKYQNYFNLLNEILPVLGKYPRKGIEIVIAGLNSISVETRYASIGVLNAWNETNWSQELRILVDNFQNRNAENKVFLENMIQSEYQSRVIYIETHDKALIPEKFLSLFDSFVKIYFDKGNITKEETYCRPKENGSDDKIENSLKIKSKPVLDSVILYVENFNEIESLKNKYFEEHQFISEIEFVKTDKISTLLISYIKSYYKSKPNYCISNKELLVSRGCPICTWSDSENRVIVKQYFEDNYFGTFRVEFDENGVVEEYSHSDAYDIDNVYGLKDNYELSDEVFGYYLTNEFLPKDIDVFKKNKLNIYSTVYSQYELELKLLENPNSTFDKFSVHEDYLLKEQNKYVNGKKESSYKTVYGYNDKVKYYWNVKTEFFSQKHFGITKYAYTTDFDNRLEFTYGPSGKSIAAKYTNDDSKFIKELIDVNSFDWANFEYYKFEDPIIPKK